MASSQLITWSCCHSVNLSQAHFFTESSRHMVILSQASTVQSYEWAKLNYAGKTDEAGNGYTASFVAVTIFQDTP